MKTIKVKQVKKIVEIFKVMYGSQNILYTTVVVERGMFSSPKLIIGDINDDKRVSIDENSDVLCMHIVAAINRDIADDENLKLGHELGISTEDYEIINFLSYNRSMYLYTIRFDIFNREYIDKMIESILAENKIEKQPNGNYIGSLCDVKKLIITEITKLLMLFGYEQGHISINVESLQDKDSDLCEYVIHWEII